MHLLAVSRFFGGTAIFTALLLAAGCDSRSTRDVEGDAQPGLFTVVATVEFAEDPSDPLVQVTDLAVARSGGFYVVDGPAGRIRHFDDTGAIAGTLGRNGDGPGELKQPTSIALTGDSVFVVERGSPRLTLFISDSLVRVTRIPGQYGFWIGAVGGGLAVGIGTPSARFANISTDGTLHTRYGVRDPRIAETPYWVFFVRERATLLGDQIVTNSSFSPTIRVFDFEGDSLSAFGSPPPSWRPPVAPPEVDNMEAESRQAAIAAWSESFSVVTQLAVVADSLIVVGYGRHDPAPSNPDRLVHETIDVYDGNGTKLHENIPFAHEIVHGGRYLYVITGSPPDPWTISVMEWARRTDDTD